MNEQFSKIVKRKETLDIKYVLVQTAENQQSSSKKK